MRNAAAGPAKGTLSGDQLLLAGGWGRQAGAALPAVAAGRGAGRRHSRVCPEHTPVRP